MKKLLVSLMILTTSLMMCSCENTENTQVQVTETTTTENVQTEITTIEETEESETQEITTTQEIITTEKAIVELTDTQFNEYFSNTYVATGNNYVVESADKITYRAYFPVEEYGQLDYCFYFSNTVDSTYKYGELAYVGRTDGHYTIESAYICDGGTSVEDEITNRTEVTFDGGNISKEVSEGETFWSDNITMDIPKDHYLVWEWTITGENIPSTYMSSLTSATADTGDGNFKYCDSMPLPQLIGAKRDVKHNVVAMGDSITQGCQTEFMAYEFWSARIAQALGSDYAFWNCGLGWSRTSDASQCNNWLSRVTKGDIVIVAFGTNDIVSGEYQGNGGNSAQEIIDYLKVVLNQLKNSGCEIILFNAPPEDYNEEHEKVRIEYNELVKNLASEYDINFFDFASYLSTEEEPRKALYGGHPNGEGGQIVADAFMEQFAELLEVE